jgi:hypothetical protein
MSKEAIKPIIMLGMEGVLRPLITYTSQAGLQRAPEANDVIALLKELNRNYGARIVAQSNTQYAPAYHTLLSSLDNSDLFHSCFVQSYGDKKQSVRRKVEADLSLRENERDHHYVLESDARYSDSAKSEGYRTSEPVNSSETYFQFN